MLLGSILESTTSLCIDCIYLPRGHIIYKKDNWSNGENGWLDAIVEYIKLILHFICSLQYYLTLVALTCSKLTMKTPAPYVKSVQS